MAVILLATFVAVVLRSVSKDSAPDIIATLFTVIPSTEPAPPESRVTVPVAAVVSFISRLIAPFVSTYVRI